MKRDASWNERSLKATFFNFDIEFFILVITIFSMIRLRSSEQEERKRKTESQKYPKSSRISLRIIRGQELSSS